MGESASIMLAPYPTGVEAWHNPEAEARMAAVKDTIHAARSLRAQYGLTPQVGSRKKIGNRHARTHARTDVCVCVWGGCCYGGGLLCLCHQPDARTSSYVVVVVVIFLCLNTIITTTTIFPYQQPGAAVVRDPRGERGAEGDAGPAGRRLPHARQGREGKLLRGFLPPERGFGVVLRLGTCPPVWSLWFNL